MNPLIDSSGRRALRADGTVLDLLPIGQAIAITGALLVALFVLVKPEASNGLDTAGRIAFWTLHVGLGLAALGVSSRWLASRERLPNSTLAAVLVTGCAAIVIAAPGYLALDALFASHVIDLDEEPSTGSLVVALVSEVLDLALWFLAVWLLINLPVLLPRPTVSYRVDDTVVHATDDDLKGKEAPDVVPVRANACRLLSSQPPEVAQILRLADDASSASVSTPQVDKQGERFLASLPGVVGKDVIAIASDLHYLNVWTVAGRTTVLGNLKDVITDLGDIGMQVHRSHWVAHSHVRRIVGTASDSACILSNELRVPISRRRWRAVREQYGRGVVRMIEVAKHADEPCLPI